MEANEVWSMSSTEQRKGPKKRKGGEGKEGGFEEKKEKVKIRKELNFFGDVLYVISITRIEMHRK